MDSCLCGSMNSRVRRPSRSKSLGQKKSSSKKEDPNTSVVPFLIFFGISSCNFDNLECWGLTLVVPGGLKAPSLFLIWIIDAFLFSCKWF